MERNGFINHSAFTVVVGLCWRCLARLMPRSKNLPGNEFANFFDPKLSRLTHLMMIMMMAMTTSVINVGLDCPHIKVFTFQK